MGLDPDWRGGGEEPEGTDGGAIIIRMLFMKTIYFNKQSKKKNRVTKKIKGSHRFPKVSG